MGYWTYLLRWRDTFKDFDVVARKASASPATGYSATHIREQEEIVTKAFK